MSYTDLGYYQDFLEEYLCRRGIDLGKKFSCLNPDHEDRNPSMSFFGEARKVHCFSCGVSYDLFDLLGFDYGLNTFPEQYAKAEELFGMGRKMKRCEETDRTLEKKTVSQLQEDFGTEWSYFLSRGISIESCKRFGFFEKDGRAYLPVLEAGICTSWTSRAIQGNIKPRYKNSPGPMGVWNSDYLTCQRPEDEEYETIYVTEGIFNGAVLEQLGYRAIALCGSNNVSKFISLCERVPDNVSRYHFVCCGDTDQAGERMNEALQEGLKAKGFSCSVLHLMAGDGDLNDLYLRDPELLRERIEGEKAERYESVCNYCATTAASCLAEFLRETERRGEGISTGFDGLDKLLDGGFYPGLYVVGAISSLGKTSFLLQVADYVSAHSTDVLYFSMEQSRYELIAKSLSRTSALLCGPGSRSEAFTVRQLLSGRGRERPELLSMATTAYKKGAEGLFLREGISGIGAEEIRSAVRDHLTMRQKKPVVMVDYLQILKASDFRATDKQNTDRAVVELKRISRDFDVPVVVVSSFNRENYRATVSMEAFKESGAVEYSADVLLGMQLAGAGEKDFDVNSAKIREPRRVELVLLKNRNGIPYAKLRFDYYAKYSLFLDRGER